MKCVRCPLFTWWNNESDKGESCGLFGDGWDNPLQYEDKDGNTIGCYVDRNYIEKADSEYHKHLDQEVDAWLEQEERKKNRLPYSPDSNVQWT